MSPPPTALLGIPYDRHSSFLRGPAEAPAAVRAALHSGSANWTTERGVDVDPAADAWTDHGDIELDNDDPGRVVEVLTRIRRAAAVALEDGGGLLSIGGDHLVTWPVVRAVAERHPDLTIVHLDAHPDLYDHLDGDRFSHACPFARIMEEGLARRLVQLGIRTATAHQRDQAERFGVELHELRSWDGTVPGLDGPVYLSIDVDVLDPAFAPGVSHHEPGGMSTRDLIDLLHQVADRGASVVAADVVEINPRRDVNGVTAMVGAKLCRELLGLIRARLEPTARRS